MTAPHDDEPRATGGPGAARPGAPAGGAPEADALGDGALARQEEELAPELAALSPEGLGPARPPFRAALRASFVAGRFEGDGAPTGAVARGLEALRAPAARPEFRAALRARFLAEQAPAAGAVPTPGAAAPPASARVSAHAGPQADRRSARPTVRTAGPGPHGARGDAVGLGPARSAPTAAPPAPARRGRRRAWGAALAALAGAAAVLLVLRAAGLGPLGSGAPRVLPWSPLAGAAVPVGVTVGGRAVGDATELAAAVAEGGEVVTGEAAVRLALGADLVVELGARTRAILPAVAPGGDIALRLDTGAVRVATGRPFRAGAPARALTVSTPHVEVAVLGTVFGVDVDRDSTCVCCLEGAVTTHAHLAGAAQGPPPAGPVQAGRTRVTFGDGRVLDEALVAVHRAPLVALAAAWRS